MLRRLTPLRAQEELRPRRRRPGRPRQRPDHRPRPRPDSPARSAGIAGEQLDRVCGYIDIGRQQGAEVVAGGGGAGTKGYFVEPTVLAKVDQKARVVQEEIFGPVVVAMPYDDLDQVAAWANDTLGLGASIWSNDLSRVHRLIPKIAVHRLVNCHNMLDPALPFGGYKQSGFGKEWGGAALDAYLEQKSVLMMV
ncbi:MAG: aldehyde dehydrogenase family protein [Comamonadaceae bacterium]|nr:aldehyde dehydrogenase family protein [Comamonadaceae bacterium]